MKECDFWHTVKLSVQSYYLLHCLCCPLGPSSGILGWPPPFPHSSFQGPELMPLLPSKRSPALRPGPRRSPSPPCKVCLPDWPAVTSCRCRAACWQMCSRPSGHLSDQAHRPPQPRTPRQATSSLCVCAGTVSTRAVPRLLRRVFLAVASLLATASVAPNRVAGPLKEGLYPVEVPLHQGLQVPHPLPVQTHAQ